MDNDGAIYRYGGQVYFTVDDNLYIRDSRGAVKLHINTNAGIIEQENWIVPTLVNGWVNYSKSNGYNPAGFFKDKMGVLLLRGLIKRPGLGPFGYASWPSLRLFTLPVGYKPAFREFLTSARDPVGIGSRIDIASNGEVHVMVGSGGWTSLDGITFRAHH